MKGKIQEIFESIQGEGVYFGERQLFVRLYGCNIKCRFCDTERAPFTEYEPGELLQQIMRAHSSRCVSFTGGEPLLQHEYLREILRMLQPQNKTVYLETNGTLPENLSEVIEYVDIVAMDFKLPSTTGQRPYWKEHLEFLKISQQKKVFIKTVISSTTSFPDVMECVNLIKAVDSSLVLVLQPEYSEDLYQLEPRLFEFKEICTKAGVICLVIPQLHKLIGVK